MKLLIDRVHRLPRIWSNRELEQFAHYFTGDVVNVSAWKDVDKQGRKYRDYFRNARSYSITNYKAEARGLQGEEGELFLDLEQPLSPELMGRFDVVFNHTTLEHIYEIRKAFANLCSMSRDIVILVLPFIQQYHANYGDYWRLTPLAIKRLFEENGFQLLYQSFNSHTVSSVYTFTIATKQPENWRERFRWSYSIVDPTFSGHEPFIGCNAINNRSGRIAALFDTLLIKPFTLLKRPFCRNQRQERNAEAESAIETPKREG